MESERLDFEVKLSLRVGASVKFLALNMHVIEFYFEFDLLLCLMLRAGVVVYVHRHSSVVDLH